MAGTIVADTIQDGAGNSTSMDNAIYGSAKAWAQFGSGASPAIAASYNISSITQTGTGVYAINFTNAFADNKYSAIMQCSNSSGGSALVVNVFSNGSTYQAPTSSGFTFLTLTRAGGVTDAVYNCLAVYR